MAAAGVTTVLTRKGKRRRGGFALVAAVAAVWQVRTALAQTDNWIAGNGNWSDPSNWSPQAPEAGDSVSIAFSDGINRTINYDAAAFPVLLNSLTLDQTNSSTSASSVLLLQGNSLNANFEYLGITGEGAIAQTGGTNTDRE